MAIIKNQRTNTAARPAQTPSISSPAPSSSNEKPLRHVASGAVAAKKPPASSKLTTTILVKQENNVKTQSSSSTKACKSNKTNTTKQPNNTTDHVNSMNVDTSNDVVDISINVIRPLNAPRSEAIQQKFTTNKQQQSITGSSSIISPPHANSSIHSTTRSPLKRLISQLSRIIPSSSDSLSTILNEIDQYLEESEFSTSSSLVKFFFDMIQSEDVEAVVRAFQYLKNISTHASKKSRIDPPNAYYDLMTCLRVAYHSNTMSCLDKVIKSGRQDCYRQFFLLNTDLSLLFNVDTKKHVIKTEGVNTSTHSTMTTMISTTNSITPKQERPVVKSNSSSSSLIPPSSPTESLISIRPPPPPQQQQQTLSTNNHSSSQATTTSTTTTLGPKMLTDSTTHSTTLLPNTDSTQLLNLPIKQEPTSKQRKLKFTSQVRTDLIVYWKDHPSESGTNFFKSDETIKKFLRHASLDDSYITTLKNNAGSILLEYEKAMKN